MDVRGWIDEEITNYNVFHAYKPDSQSTRLQLIFTDKIHNVMEYNEIECIIM